MKKTNQMNAIFQEVKDETLRIEYLDLNTKMKVVVNYRDDMTATIAEKNAKNCILKAYQEKIFA